jgi:pimeloyl-ACP methyl ester carboxylesterase
MCLALAAAVLVISVVGCGAQHSATVRALPASGLVDAPLELDAAGLPARADVVIQATTRDLGGTTLSASSRVRTDGQGGLHLRGQQAARLLWALRPAADGDYENRVPFDGETVRMAVLRGSRTLARTAFRRRLRAADVTVQELRPRVDGVYGSFFRRRGSGGGIPVVLVGGSEGGLAVPFEAAVLASHGFPTLSLAYFDEPGLPRAISSIPLESFGRAAAWVARATGAKHVALIGVSRGSEAVLLTAIRYPRLVAAVVAAVPGNVVLCGYPGPCGPSWTYKGHALPFQSSYGPSFQSSFGPIAESARTAIPVERFPGALLLVCGGAGAARASCATRRRATGSACWSRTSRSRSRTSRALRPMQIRSLGLRHGRACSRSSAGGADRSKGQEHRPRSTACKWAPTLVA